MQKIRQSLTRSARFFSTNGDYFPITAAVARSASAPFSLESLHLRPLRPEEIRVKIVATGVCHTDIVCKSKGFVPFPIVLGHEGVGEIDEIGSGVTNYSRGDHVILSYASCGFCPHCAMGKPSYCFSHGPLNFAGRHPDGSLTMKNMKNPQEEMHGAFFQQSSFASHAIVTANNTLKVKKSLNLAALAPLGCGIQTGAGAVLNSLALRPEDSLGVWGCGAVGLSAIMAARVARARPIIALDLNENRLKLAATLGATHTIKITGQEKDGEIAKQIKDIIPPGLQYALDTSGNKFALKAGFDSLRPMGVAALIGGSGDSVSISMGDLLHGRSVRGIVQGDSVTKNFLPKLIQLWENGEFPYESLITYYQDGLSSLDQAFLDSTKINGNIIKPVIRVSQ